jgi:sugar phosphate isomerase/epimerase
MQLKLIRHLWGIELPWEQAFPKIKAEGFVGIESPLPPEADVQRFCNLLKQHEFEFIGMAFTGGETIDAHLKSFREQLISAKSMGAMQVTAHTGADAWSISQAVAFYEQAVAIEREIGIAVGHETHRGRVFFNPWRTRDILEKVSGVNLTCDFSHWVCVAERTGWDDAQGSIVKLCAQRCIHIHSRVGYAQGPQVPDPSAKEYQAELNAHELWWDIVWQAQRSRGAKTTTVTPEFGPPAYLHTLPHTNVPVADLWTVCKFMADRVASRFQTAHVGTSPS